MSKNSSSHYWVLHIESLQYLENTHKCINVYMFVLLLVEVLELFCLFKLSFLLLPHITPDIFSESVLLQLSVSEKR